MCVCVCTVSETNRSVNFTYADTAANSCFASESVRKYEYVHVYVCMCVLGVRGSYESTYFKVLLCFYI